MITMSLADGPVFISNLAVLIETAADIIHEFDRDRASAVIDDLDRVSSLLSIANQSCRLTVDAIEAGPDYKLGPERKLGDAS